MLNFPPGSHLPSSTRNRWPGPRLGRMPPRAQASFPSAHRAAGTAPEALEHRPPLAAVTHREGVLLLWGLMELPLPASSVSSLVLSFHRPNQVWVSPTTETAVRTTKARGSREPSLAHLRPDQRLPQPRPAHPWPSPLHVQLPTPLAPPLPVGPLLQGPRPTPLHLLEFPLLKFLGPRAWSPHMHATPWATGPCLSARDAIERPWLMSLAPSASLTVLGYGGRSKLTPQRQWY